MLLPDPCWQQRRTDMHTSPDAADLPADRDGTPRYCLSAAFSVPSAVS